MKAQIHPTYHTQAKVFCACGNSFTTGSTLSEVHVEVCSKCHPFFTGQMRYVDTAGRVDKFKERMQTKSTKVSKREKRALKKQRRVEQELTRPTSLADVRIEK